MKIHVELGESIKEKEIIIKTNTIDNEVLDIQKIISESIQSKSKITLIKEDSEYFISLEDILFFESDDDKVYAHLNKDSYLCKYRLYELEETLPRYFMRVSKSTILNIHHIFSITRSLSTSALVEFQYTHKKVYISRHYFKPLKERLESRGTL